MYTYSIRLEKDFHHRGSQWSFQSVLVSEIIPGGKGEDKARQAVFLTPWNLSGPRADRGETFERRNFDRGPGRFEKWMHQICILEE